MLPHGDDEEKWLAEGIAGIQHNAFYMHRALVGTQSRYDALIAKPNLHHSPNMLSELRTSLLSPHKYYELCELGCLFDLSCSKCCLCRSWILMCFFSGDWEDMRAFDELRKMEMFFREETARGTISVIELYELVQHAGNILPRL
ncbi:hypothetical protein GW17_00050999 [Ensete ventricosum]|uniref:Uncharacterized protein n=1 Tax=Ensete ventricosum TaxID=4639 RepID=A0A444CME9_ENSVE|nr:hypothetical protein GW17_00050999 [Ensete ventricosum]RZR73797.1 hypothetical protein BHM03_00028170 [Ensete ventricosum]